VIAWQESKRKVSPKQKEQISAFTWYSVRHVSITRLITEGEFSLERVAEKANTGIDMIEQFYWKRLQNPEKRLVSRHPKASSREQEVRETRTTPRDDLELLRTMGSD
tara:strand:- start:185 stop:505 length:321 start_codon:yes stop_codon:yes gene_type:complete